MVGYTQYCRREGSGCYTQYCRREGSGCYTQSTVGGRAVVGYTQYCRKEGSGWLYTGLQEGGQWLLYTVL